MTDERAKKKQVEAKPLATRHAFLDTQVYRKLKHNPENKAFQVLAEHITSYRVVLHITDITLSEVARQIAEDIELTRAALGKARKDVERWRHSVPEISAMPELGEETARRLFAAFHATATQEWRAKEHNATSHPADSVFADYFARRPPFDSPGSKEFPDAFVLHTLEAWCARQKERMYVVTRDAAMKRFVEASPHLLVLDTIEELLAAASASAEDDGDAEAIADALLNAPEFDFYFEQAIESHIDELILIYDGDLPEGEVTGAGLGGVIQFLDYRIVARTSERIGLLVNAGVELVAAIAYEDRDLAMYDSEDDVWIGGEWDTAEVPNSVTLELYLELEVATGRVATSELIRNEFHIH